MSTADMNIDTTEALELSSAESAAAPAAEPPLGLGLVVGLGMPLKLTLIGSTVFSKLKLVKFVPAG